MIALALAVALTSPPTYLVERVARSDGGSVRLSVFRDQVAALVRRSAAQAAAQVVTLRLGEVEYAVVAQVVEECYDELARLRGAGGAPGHGEVEWRLAPVGRPPLLVRWPAAAVPPLALARLEQALLELQRRVEEARPDAEDFSGWEPRVGERVLLRDGREGTVGAVLAASGGPLVELRVGPVVQFLPVEELRRQAVRRLGR